MFECWCSCRCRDWLSLNPNAKFRCLTWGIKSSKRFGRSFLGKATNQPLELRGAGACWVMICRAVSAMASICFSQNPLDRSFVLASQHPHTCMLLAVFTDHCVTGWGWGNCGDRICERRRLRYKPNTETAGRKACGVCWQGYDKSSDVTDTQPFCTEGDVRSC